MGAHALTALHAPLLAGQKSCMRTTQIICHECRRMMHAILGSIQCFPRTSAESRVHGTCTWHLNSSPACMEPRQHACGHAGGAPIPAAIKPQLDDPLSPPPAKAAAAAAAAERARDAAPQQQKQDHARSRSVDRIPAAARVRRSSNPVVAPLPPAGWRGGDDVRTWSPPGRKRSPGRDRDMDGGALMCWRAGALFLGPCGSGMLHSLVMKGVYFITCVSYVVRTR